MSQPNGGRPAAVAGSTRRQAGDCGRRWSLMLAAMLMLTGCAAREPAPALSAASAGAEIPAAESTASPVREPAYSGSGSHAGTAADESDSTLADARRGDAHAQLLVAERYLAGNGVPRDLRLAHEWLEKSVAQDHAPALDVLSALHYRGVGVAVDYRKAKELMERAAARRYLPAINNLAWFLATCPDASVRDGRRAVELLAPAMDQSAQMLDTYAAALAETGDFERAGEYQRLAVMALSGVEDPRFGSFIERLAWYGAGKPWRDPPQDAPRAPQKIP
jgi:TPR repeat protein